MGKVKNTLVILLTMILLAAGSLLPSAAAYMQDETTANVVQYENIEALQLKLEEEQPTMSMLEKLFLMVNGTGKEVTEDVMRMNGGEAIEAAYAALQPYADIYGLPLDNDELQYFSHVVFDENDPYTLNNYWQIYLSLDISENDQITVILDDETGKLMAMELNDWDMNIDAAYLQELQDAVSEVYIGALGLDPVAAWPVDVESAGVGYDQGNVYMITRYQFVDVRYGEVNVEVGVHNDGFYIIPV